MKPGIKTTEFWAMVFIDAAAAVTQLSSVNVLPQKYAALAAGIATGLYAVGRGIAKLNKPV